MRYNLNPNIALRGWRLVPRAYYIRGQQFARGLSEEELDILRQCGGGADIPPSPALEGLLTQGLCLPAGDGNECAPLSEWQKYRFCDNRYFPAVNWAVTGRCNFNCRHCFNAADNAPINAEFSWEQCLDFIRQLDECGVQNVTLTGGEPMLHPRFTDICLEISKRGMIINELTTNGSFITAEILDEFKRAGINPLFKLSFDGAGHHDWFRMKEGAERSVLEKTKLLIDRGFTVRWQTNVHRGNVDTILPTVKLADSMGVGGIRVIRTSEAPRWAEMGGDLCLSINEYYDFALELTREFLREDLRIDLVIWQIISLWPENKLYVHRPVESGERVYRDSLPVCRGARGLIAVTPEGDIVPCNQLSGFFKKHGIQMGNVHETPLRELLNGGEYLKAVCFSAGELKDENPKCQTCPHFKLCLGGCRAAGALLNGGYRKYDPIKCIYFDGYYEKFASLFGGEWRCAGDAA